MSKTQYTPGPWTARIEGGKLNVFGRTEDGLDSLFIAKVIAPQNGFKVIKNYEEIGKANARLIAAAPELLEALKAILPYAKNEARTIQEDGTQSEKDRVWALIDKAREAIAKATGN